MDQQIERFDYNVREEGGEGIALPIPPLELERAAGDPLVRT